MQKFIYRALKDNKVFVEGEVEASDAREARQKIRELGFLPTKVYEETAQITQTQTPTLQDKSVFLSLSQKISFTSELETLLSAGIPILEALSSIETNSPDVKLKKICAELKNAITSGKTFAQGLSQLYGNTFGEVYTSLVKTGEDAGELEQTLERMLTLLRKQDNIKGKIINASIYPCVLLVMLFGLLVLFAKFVFPAFAGVIGMNGGELPLLAQSLIGLFNFVDKFWWVILVGFGALGAVLPKLFKEKSVKSVWDNFVLKIPVLSDFIEYVNISNYLTVLQIAYDAGVPIISGLELSARTVGNFNIRERAERVIPAVKSGKLLSEAFQRTRTIPDALLGMISAGEKSGTLGKMFHDAVEVVDKKVDMALEALTRLFEPTVLVIIGGFVLVMVIAFFQAYVGMLGSLF